MKTFGLAGLSATAITCHANILPQAVLQYGQGMTLDPKLEGILHYATHACMIIIHCLPSTFLSSHTIHNNKIFS